MKNMFIYILGGSVHVLHHFYYIILKLYIYEDMVWDNEYIFMYDGNETLDTNQLLQLLKCRMTSKGLGGRGALTI